MAACGIVGSQVPTLVTWTASAPEHTDRGTPFVSLMLIDVRARLRYRRRPTVSDCSRSQFLPATRMNRTHGWRSAAQGVARAGNVGAFTN
jgi:hypothetical protein